MKNSSAKHDVWELGSSYESYIGCWSYQIALSFLKKIDTEPGMDWVDIGCGTGALTRAILLCCQPFCLTGVEPSLGMLNWTNQQLKDKNLRFIEGKASDLPFTDDSVDIAVSGLVLNFLPEPVHALKEMKRIVRPGGRIAFYVWDYAHGGLELVRAFWNAAVSVTPDARRFSDAVRFSWCNEDSLTDLMVEAGLKEIKSERIVIPTLFENFEDYWQRFSKGAGPASSYYKQLPLSEQTEIRTTLQNSFTYNPNGSLELSAAAWALQGIG